MRQLATIQKIKSLEAIEGADSIEKATVLGWHLVVKKGEFTEGDLCVFCEPDSVMPDKPEFDFLKSKGMRIKTIRLRGQVSQGIAFHPSILPSGVNLKEGNDVSNIIGVIKYERSIPACLTGQIKGSFPSFIPKTDETRVQVLQKVLDKYKGVECYITEKIDGSSATYYINDGVFGVCSRNMDLIETEGNSFWKLARELDIEDKLRSLSGNYAVQGELFGEGIQGNKLKIKGQKLNIFNVFDIDSFQYLGFEKFKEILQYIDLPSVPIIEHDFKLINDIDKLVEKSTIRSVLNKDVWAEGIVIRPIMESLDLHLSNLNFNSGRVSFKVINPEFLIKYND